MTLQVQDFKSTHGFFHIALALLSLKFFNCCKSLSIRDLEKGFVLIIKKR